MTDFHTALRARLERLDAAMPQPAGPNLPAARLPHRHRRRRQVVALLAATAVLAIGTTLAAVGSAPPPTPQEEARIGALEERVRNALAPLFPDDECVGQEEAVRRLRLGLDDLGLANWNIRHLESLTGARCTMFGASAETREVVLIGRSDPGVPDAMERVGDQLLAECLDRSQATELVTTALANLGITDVVVSVDGPRAAPIDKHEEYQQHVANGCFVYGSIGRDESGRLVVYLWGP